MEDIILQIIYVLGIIGTIIFGIVTIPKRDSEGKQYVSDSECYGTMILVAFAWPLVVALIPLMHWDDRRHGHNWFKKEEK